MAPRLRFITVFCCLVSPLHPVNVSIFLDHSIGFVPLLWKFCPEFWMDPNHDVFSRNKGEWCRFRARVTVAVKMLVQMNFLHPFVTLNSSVILYCIVGSCWLTYSSHPFSWSTQVVTIEDVTREEAGGSVLPRIEIKHFRKLPEAVHRKFRRPSQSE